MEVKRKQTGINRRFLVSVVPLAALLLLGTVPPSQTSSANPELHVYAVGPYSAKPNTWGNVTTFLIQNTGTSNWYYYVSCYPYGAVTTCGAPNEKISVPAGGSTQVQVEYSTGSAGSGQIVFRTYYPHAQDTAPITVAP